VAAVWLCASGLANAEPAAADDVAKLAAEIDRLIEARWRASSARPADRADDAEFLRRVWLHIGGSIPPVATTRAFLADESSDKRRRMVDELLESSGYVVHFTRTWRRAMLPETESDLQTRFVVPGFEAWLREKLASNVPYDRLVREIVATPLESGNQQDYFQRLQSASPLAFFQAKQVAPENLAAATSRIFLGVRIECAQCHDHPFDKWKRDQFWSYAAFFAGIERQRQGDFIGVVREIEDRREINVPDSGRVVQATYLDGSQPQWRFRVGPRQTLADWLTSRDNPLFARAAVNRMWGHFFGVGIVEPIDDFTETNPPSHPELLDLLAQEFAAHDFDLKFLIRAITASRAYQLTSRQGDASQDLPLTFARMSLQGLSPEQLYDSLLQASGAYEPFQTNRAFIFGGSPQGDFLESFADEGAPKTDRETTILQALAMMNGAQVAQATSPQAKGTLGAVVDAPFLDTAGRIEALYLAALSRPPRAEELQRLVAYVDGDSAASESPEGNKEGKHASSSRLGNVFWALLNSTEFLMNH
jgi:hypothetical protein